VDFISGKVSGFALNLKVIVFLHPDGIFLTDMGHEEIIMFGHDELIFMRLVSIQFIFGKCEIFVSAFWFSFQFLYLPLGPSVMGSPVQEGPTLLPHKIVYFLQIRVFAVVVMLRFNVHELFVDA
jgi:hypothetical protein